MNLPKALKPLKADLNATGLPWALDRGSKHIKILINGRIAGIYPHHGRADAGGPRAIKNLQAQIKRFTR